MKSDLVRKALTSDGEAVVIAVDATQLVQNSLVRLGAWPPSMIHLGQAMLGALLLQGLPDRHDDEKLELQWKTSGPFGGVFAECREASQIRGTIFEPQAPVPNLTTSLGPGLLQVRRIRAMASTGIVEAQGDIALDLLDYLEKSEQKNCAMNLWVDIANDANPSSPDQPFVIRHAYGFLVHVIPVKAQADTDRALLKWDHHVRSLGPISKWVIGKDPTFDMLSFVTAEFKPKILSEKKVDFFCTCNEERAERALALMTDAERREFHLNAIGPNAKEEVKCEFCGRTYLIATPPPEGLSS